MSEKSDYGNTSSEKSNSAPDEHIRQMPSALKSHGPFADHIRELRDYYGYSQKQVAAYLGLTAAAYGYYERGDRSPTPAMIASLSMLYDINVLDLLIYAIQSEKPSILEEFVRETEEYAARHSMTLNAPPDPYRMTVTEEERRLLRHYRAQSSSVKKYINQIVKLV